MLPNSRIFFAAALLVSVAAPLRCQNGDLSGFQIGPKVVAPSSDLAELADVFDLYRAQFIQYLRSKPAHAAFKQNVAFRATFRSVLQGVEDGRVDEQAGASAGSGGAASVAEKPGITGLITAALESGAMAQTFDQNLLTLRGNAEGLFRFLTGQEVLPVCQTPQSTDCDPSALNNLELTASLDVSNTNSQTVNGRNPLTGAQLAALLSSDKRQFSSASARYAIVNSRDLRSAKYRAAWLQWYSTHGAAFALAGAELLKALDEVMNLAAKTPARDVTGNPIVVAGIPLSVYKAWELDAKAALKAAPRTEAAVGAVLAQRFDLLEAEIRRLIPDLDARLEVAANAYVRFFNITRQGFALANMPMLTAQFTYSEPTLQPKLIEGKLSFAWSPKTHGTVNPGTVTFNGGFSAYTKPQPSDSKGGTARWRHAQLAFQFDRPMGGDSAPVAIAVGAYFQYQISPGLINIPSGTTAPGGVALPGNATLLLAPKGTIAVAHASITLHIPKSGIKLPIGISWSNRTELLPGNEVRAHIGFNFDTHSQLLAPQ